MNRVFQFAAGCVLTLLSSSCKELPKTNWEIAYHRVDYFFGCIDIKIGTDSCYYLNQGSIHKNPPVLTWKSRKKELNVLYNDLEKLCLQGETPLMAAVTAMPFETLELRKNDKVIFSLQKDQQSVEGVKKFEKAVTLLMSFVLLENR